jgi:hypothetical protein
MQRHPTELRPNRSSKLHTLPVGKHLQGSEMLPGGTPDY